MTDDQSHDTLTSEFMPYTKAMIADQGMVATQFIMPTPLCCPSRASLLTGKYARHHGVCVNRQELVGSTFVNQLHDAGYYTGLIGKYLNSWPGDPRPEFDYWTAWISGYNDPIMNVFGALTSVPGYLTYIQRDYANDFFDKLPSGKPFFLLFTPHAPHKPATPAPGDEHLFAKLPPWRPPNFNPAEQRDKPDWLARMHRMTDSQVHRRVDTLRLEQLRCLHSVDLAVRDVLLRLQREGKLDSTFVVFYSDNGFFWGEHRLSHKNRVYEEASRGPFAVRYPALIKAGEREDRLTSVIDLAPTICELAGLPVPADTDGRSLVSLFRGTDQWRDAILLEGWPGSSESTNGSGMEDELEATSAEGGAESPGVPNPPATQDYQAIRTAEYVYIETIGDKSELYHLRSDPYQLHNLIDQPGYNDIVNQLRDRLHHGKL